MDVKEPNGLANFSDILGNTCTLGDTIPANYAVAIIPTGACSYQAKVLCLQHQPAYCTTSFCLAKDNPTT
jgi:hypothetical protein